MEHWTHVYHLNGTLVNLVEAMTIHYRARYWPLNPTVAPWKHNNNANTQNRNKVNESRTSHVTSTSEEWIYSGKIFSNNIRRSRSEPTINVNPCNMLVEFDCSAPNCRVEEMTHKTQNGEEVTML